MTVVLAKFLLSVCLSLESPELGRRIASTRLDREHVSGVLVTNCCRKAQLVQSGSKRSCTVQERLSPSQQDSFKFLFLLLLRTRFSSMMDGDLKE